MEPRTNWIKYGLNWLLDILFPQRCLSCNTRGIVFCDQCIARITHAKRETETNIIAVYDYRDPLIKRAIWNLKYYRQRHLGDILGHMLYGELLEDIADIRSFTGPNKILVIPVPISRSRSKIRGYNQAEAIAKSFCRAGGKELFLLRTDIVRKKTQTIPQARIANRAERLKNIKDAFEIVRPTLVRGTHVIVIDDVTTTGATLGELMKLIKKSGAKSVIGFAVAH